MLSLTVVYFESYIYSNECSITVNVDIDLEYPVISICVQDLQICMHWDLTIKRWEKACCSSFFSFEKSWSEYAPHLRYKISLMPRWKYKWVLAKNWIFLEPQNYWSINFSITSKELSSSSKVFIEQMTSAELPRDNLLHMIVVSPSLAVHQDSCDVAGTIQYCGIQIYRCW